jgi:hypothetical protein
MGSSAEYTASDFDATLGAASGTGALRTSPDTLRWQCGHQSESGGRPWVQ